MYLGDFRNLNYTEKGTFGEPITMIGFPSTDQDGSVLVPTMQFAISAKSKNQDAAWQFLRYYLTEDTRLSSQHEGIGETGRGSYGSSLLYG